MKKVCVNQDLCIGCGACVSITDKYFAFDDQGLSNVIKENIEEEDLDIVCQAKDSCPVDAIEIKDNIKEENTAA